MRIVVVGATGNVGTAVLERLHAEGVTDVVGVSRRLPDPASSPYADVSWHSIDISSAEATGALTSVFAGADAVIHLAWLLQPNRDEETMWRTNVVGLRHVLAAVRAAGVDQIVVASSVGAYSAGPKHRRVDESWPTGGLHTSHYSRHKAMNERELDRFERAEPGIVVTRLRPGLVMQARAGAELATLFLGPLIPTGWMGRVPVPVVPLPTRMVSQVVHASDLADAFWRAVSKRAGGAFNIAAEPVVGPEEVAGLLGGRAIPFRAPVLRAIVLAAWRLRLMRTDPGWVDIATGVPVMSTERARLELGWTPSVGALDALEEALDGVADGTRQPGSRSLDPR